MNSNNLATLEMAKQKMSIMPVKKEKFSGQEVNLLILFCNQMKYHISFNRQNQIAKVYNPVTGLMGYIQKSRNKLWFGNFNNEKQFIRKYTLNENLKLFVYFQDHLNKKMTNNEIFGMSLPSFFSNIIDLEYKFEI